MIIGSHGNDQLTGGGANDFFVFAPGSAADTITDFIAGPGTDDRIDLRTFAGGGIADLNAVLTHATQVGADTVINFGGGDALTLLGVTRTSLSADDFVFGTPPYRWLPIYMRAYI